MITMHVKGGIYMGTISIHGVSPELEKELKQKAKSHHQSLSSFIKEILENSLGKNKHRDKNRKYFEKFSGTWSDKEYNEFNAAISDFENINPEDWK
jgi:hypothetical protein